MGVKRFLIRDGPRDTGWLVGEPGFSETMI
jgi:hypothetical protein